MTRVLVVDNYDSFVFNLVQYLGQLGAECVVRRNDEAGATDLRGVDGVLLSLATPLQTGQTVAGVVENMAGMPMPESWTRSSTCSPAISTSILIFPLSTIPNRSAAIASSSAIS